ncbi:MAG: fructosamine kinase family protein [Ferruginibacter sp.]
MFLQPILIDCGLSGSRYESVAGGDINKAYCLHSDGQKYFLKVNDSEHYPAMFQKEAAGLIALSNQQVLTVPKVIKYGTVAGEQYLLLEWLDKGTPGKDFWQNFGRGLAALHQKPQPYFGWEDDNFIGNLVQINKQHASWEPFYTDCRIMPLVTMLTASGDFSKREESAAASFCNKIASVFLPEPAAILHGDLWSGNFTVLENGSAAIFDPAVYFGHREMDIGMTLLFGGFHRQFYDAYNEVYPLQKGWQQRLPFTQLYPLLVHAVLFGGHYIAKVKEIIGTV